MCFGVLGMSYIHEKGFAHRDLKSLNVLLTSTLTAKIFDFGTARKLDRKEIATLVGTPESMAPEVYT